MEMAAMGGALVFMLLAVVIGLLFAALILKLSVRMVAGFSPSYGKSVLVVFLAMVVGFIVNIMISLAVLMVAINVAKPLESTHIFPGMVTSMIEVGEETGALPDMLARIADNYDEEVDVAVASLVSLLEPLMVVLLGGIVGFEREMKDRPAGFRTHMLVGGAAALLVGVGRLAMLESDFRDSDTLQIDVLRLVEAVVAGVAFIGAGTIFATRGGQAVAGITTAADRATARETRFNMIGSSLGLASATLAAIDDACVTGR